ncbi:MAG: hypothetical protein K9M08_17940 [Pirellula sp.]|nr:hypothetical protein [Pirellula sp.]
MNETTVSHVARWANWFANLSGTSSPIRLRFSEGWIVGSGSPPFPKTGGIYIFADADGVGKPSPIDASCQRVLDVGKANKDLVRRITDHLPLCKGKRIVVYTIGVDDNLIDAFSPHFPTILEKFIFSCCVRHCGSIPEWNNIFGNGKPNHKAKPLPGARTPSGADIALWAREFVEMPTAPIPASLSLAKSLLQTDRLGSGQIAIVTLASESGQSRNLETSTDQVIYIGRQVTVFQNQIGTTTHKINVTSPCDYSRALEMFLKYSFVRCAGAPPAHNDTRRRN